MVGFALGDFTIGAIAMLGLVLVATGLLAGAHYRERRAQRSRTHEEES